MFKRYFFSLSTLIKSVYVVELPNIQKALFDVWNGKGVLRERWLIEFQVTGVVGTDMVSLGYWDRQMPVKLAWNLALL